MLNSFVSRRPVVVMRTTAAVAGAIGLAFVAALIGFRADPVRQRLFGNTLLTAGGLLAALCLTLAARSATTGAPRARLGWGLLVAAQLCSVIGNVLFAAFPLAAGGGAPPLAAIVSLSFYPLFVLAVLYLPALPLQRAERVKLVLDLSLLSLCAGLVLWLGWFAARVAFSAGDIGRLAPELAYPVGDLTLIVALAVLLARQFETRGQPLLLLAAGVGALLLTDLFVLKDHQIALAQSDSGAWLNAGRLVAYGLFALAGVYQATTSLGAPAASWLGRGLPAPLRRALAYLPFVVLAAAYGVLIWGHDHLSTANFWVLAWWVGGITLGVLLRQIAAHQDADRLAILDQRRRESDAILLELSRRLLGATDEAVVGNSAVRIAALALHASQGLLALPDADGRLTMRAGWGWPEGLVGTLTFGVGSTSQIGRTIERGIPLMVGDFSQANDFQPDPVLLQQNVASSLSAPMMMEGRIVGAMLVCSGQPRHFDDGEAAMLSLIANQAAAAFERLRLFEVARRQVQELTVLHAIASAGAEAGDEDTLLERVTSIVGESLYSSHFGIMLIEPGTSLLRSHRSYRGDNQFATPLGQGITGHVALTGSATRVADVSLDPRYLAIEPGARSELCVPLVADDQVMGVINVESANLAAFTEADEQLLVTIARQVVTALAKLRLFDRLFQAEQQRAGELEAVRQASLGLTASLDLQTVLKAILQSTLRMVAGARKAFVYLYHAEGGGRLTFGASRIRGGETEEDWEPRPHGLTYTVARQGEVVVIPDTRRHPLFAEASGDWGGAMVGLPLKIGARVVGVMNVMYLEPRSFPESDLRVLRHLGDQAAVAIENARLFEAERAAREQAEALREVAAVLSSSLDRERLLQLVLEQLARVVDFDSAAILLYSGDQLGIVAHSGFRSAEQQTVVLSPGEYAHVAEVLASSHPVTIADTQLDARWRRLPGGEYIRCWLGVPLVAQGHVIGLLSLDKAVPDFYHARDAELAAAFANQAAVAIDNARLFEAARRQLSLAETLQAVGALLTAQMSLQEVLEHIFDLLEQVIAFDSVSVQLLAADGGMELAAGRGFPDLDIARENVRFVSEQRRPEQWLGLRLMVVSDTETDARWIATTGTEYIRSWIGAALVVKGKLVGLLTTESATPEAYHAAAGETVLAFANQAAVAIENARLFEASQRQTRALSGLYDTALATGSVLDTDVLLQRLYEQVRPLLNPDTFAVAYYYADSEELEMSLAVEQGWPDKAVTLLGRVPVSLGLMGWVVRNRQSLLVGDMLEEAIPVPPRHGIQAARSWLGVPLIARDRIIGAAAVQSFQPYAFDVADRRFLESVASQVAIAIENARLYAEVTQRVAELSRLYSAAQDLGARLEPRAVLQQLARHLTEAVDVTSSYVLEVNLTGETLTVLAEYRSAAASPGERRSNIGGAYSLADRPSVHRSITRLTVVEMHLDDPGLSETERAELIRYGIKSSALVPIVSRGEVLGEAELWESRRRRVFSLAERRLLQTLCQHAGGVIENARLFEQAVQHATEVTTASEILHLLNVPADIADSFPQIAAAIKSITGCERVSLALLDQVHANVTLWALDQPRAELPRGVQYSITATAAAGDVLAGQAHLTPDLAAEREYPAESALYDAGFRSRLNLPLRVGPQVIGALNLVWFELSGYLRANLPLLSQLVDAIALALEKTRLFDETRRRDVILEALAYASGRLLMPGAPDAAMSDVLAQLGRAAGVSRAYIFENQGTGNADLLARLRFEWSAAGQPSPSADAGWRDLPYVAGGMERWANILGAGRPMDGLVRDFPASERARLEQQGVLSLAVVPIFNGGVWWGWLGFDDRESERVWSAAEIEALKSAAGALGAFLTRQAAEAAEREQRALAEALRDTAAVLNSTLDLDEVLDRILADVDHVVPHDSADIMLIEAGEAQIVRHRDLLGRVAVSDMLSVHFTVADVADLRRMLETAQPAMIEDTLVEPGWMPRPETRWIRSLVGAPILIKGQVIGFITLDKAQPGFYNLAHAERLQAFAHQAGLAIENARLYASIRQHAEELELRVVDRTRELADANRRLRELDRLKDQFISNVSHELRTPLTNIKLHLSLLDKRGSEVLPRYLPTLQRETERLRRLIEDLLDLSRLQTQTEPLPRDLVPLDDLLTEVVTVHAARAEAKNIALQHEPSRGDLNVPVDRAQMIQVFTNLIGNAVAYTPVGGHVQVSSEITGLGNAQGASIHFVNDGPLIPPEDLPHLFRRFYRGQTAHESGEPGTGLGLAICREIVERHGGQLDVTSQPGQGTIFTVWLPLT